MASLLSRRVLAYIADFFVVSAFMWIISYLLSIVFNPYQINTVYDYLPYVVPILIIVYFVLCERYKGATVGKALVYLQVRNYRGEQISWIQAIVRNLTKIYWIPIIFDLAIGLLLKRGDRILDSITKTVVVDEDEVYRL